MQKSYLNELYHQTDENKSTNNNKIPSIKKENKNKFNTINKKQKNNNIIPQNKSSLFLNNFIRLNKKTSYKNESNVIPIFKKRKKKNINVNPYQKMGNEYILNFALDNLNKYQENLLIKEKTEDEKNNFNNNNIDFSNKINYYNNFIITNNNENYEPSNNLKMNKTVKNFRSGYKNDIKQEKENKNDLPQYFTNNKNYSEYFIRNDLFNDNKKEIENEEIPEPEPYIINKYITKNKSYNNFDKTKINSNPHLIKNNNNNKNTDIKLNFTLSNLELNELQKVFEDNYIFFEDLFLLTKEDFVEMKIPIGPRNRLLNFIKKYKNYAKTFDLNELSSFMNIFKESINSNEIDTTIGETPSTNNKYKSTMNTENNKKKLNISNLEEEHNEPNNIIDDLNEIINNNNNNNNKRCKSYKTIESRNDKDEVENDKDNSNKNTNTNNTNNTNNNNNLNKNIFSNSLFNEFTSYGTDVKDSNFDFIDINNLNINSNDNNNKNQNKLNKSNPLKIECLNNLISKNNSPFITNNNILINNNNKISNQNIFMNKKNKIQNASHYKNYQNIFSEIEKYQMNYEKMKKENNDRNNKINNLLDKKNKTNIPYLKMKLKNSKYYNDEDLVNENARDLNKELQKINFFKKATSQPNNEIKKDKKQNVKNPLIEEFNKHK